MDPNKDFPNPPRKMEWDEMVDIFFKMTGQIAQWKPDEIIAVNRSGYCFAGWVSQVLKLPLGSYWPDRKILVKRPESKRLIFVDDNVLKGDTFLAARQEFDREDFDWAWAVLFSDWNTPEEIRNQIIQGTRLDYFALEPFPGSMKVSQAYGVRTRDERTDSV